MQSLLLLVLLYVTKSIHGTEPKMVLGPDVESPCKPNGKEEIDTDPLVNKMFEAYKEQANSETPAAEHAESLTDVDAHKMLGRVLFFINNILEKRKTNSEAETISENNVAKYLFGQVHSNEDRWATNNKWPYRCYNVETTKALDLFLSKLIHLIDQDSKLDNNQRLTAFEFSLVMNLPQFESYVQNLNKANLHSICSLIQTAENPDGTIADLRLIIRDMTPVAQVACHSPYDRQVYCNLASISNYLEGMSNDLQQAESSTEMKKLAFFWFYSPSLANACEDSFTSTHFKPEILTPLGESAIARLNEIVSLSTTEGSDLEKIRAFIYDYLFNHFTRYAAEELVIDKRPRAPFSGHDNKYTEMATSQSNYDVYDKPEKDLLRSYRTFLETLNDMENALVEGAGISKIRTLARIALCWFLHPDFQLETARNYNTFVEGLMHLQQDRTSLINFGKALKHYKNGICGSEIIDRSVKFCKLYEALFDIQIYATTMEDSPTAKILNPTSNYKKILELETMRQIQSDIAALEVGQEQLEQSLAQMRSSVGDHFYQLATFDQDKAEYDVGFLLDKIADFTTRINGVGLKDKLSTLINLVVGSSVAEIAQLGAQLAGAVAENCNPLKWIAGGGGVQDVLDQANALAGSATDAVKLVSIGRNSFPQLKRKANELTAAMAGNAEIHNKLNITFHQLKNKETIDIGIVQANFLMDYKNYDPGWSAGDIADYTVLLKGVIDELCGILYSGETVASNVVQAMGATDLVCLNIKTDAEILEAVYSEMYAFQYEFMEAMAVAVRALVTKHSANNVRHFPEKVDDPETYRLLLKFYAYRIKLQSKLHTLLALKDVCDVDEFKNGGIPTEHCVKAFESQSNSAISVVIGSPVDECPSNEVNQFLARIPARLNPDKHVLEPGVLDLTKLYAGELTTFQIEFSKSRPWLYKYVSDAIPVHDDIALYLKRFEIYLPDLTTTPISHDIEITIKQDGETNLLQSSVIKYGFSTPKVFTLRYGENKRRCPGGFDDSPYPKLCEPEPSQVCIASHGEVSEGEMAPPLHSKWLIQASLPRDLPAPKPSSQSVFYLRASLSICEKNPKNIDLGDRHRPGLPQETSPRRCCDEGEYFHIDADIPSINLCRECPPNSTPKLGGLYCHDNTDDRSSHRRKSSIKYRHLKDKIFGRKKVKEDTKTKKTKGEKMKKYKKH